MVEVDPGLELLGPGGSTTLLDAFEGRRQLDAGYDDDLGGDRSASDGGAAPACH